MGKMDSLYESEREKNDAWQFIRKQSQEQSLDFYDFVQQ